MQKLPNKRVIINDFIPSPENVRKCDSGHTTNGHWMVLASFLPKVFQDKVAELTSAKAEYPHGQDVIEAMSKREFHECNFSDQNEKEGILIYKCTNFKIAFTTVYILYLHKHIANLKIMASSPEEPAKLIQGPVGILDKDKEIGVLMPCLLRMKGENSMKKPIVVCLCGSTRFKDKFVEANLQETLSGKIVLTIGCDMRPDDEIFKDMTPDTFAATKRNLDRLHLAKIDLSDEVLILNVGGYIGESTTNELNYAKKKGKKVRYLE